MRGLALVIIYSLFSTKVIGDVPVLLNNFKNAHPYHKSLENIMPERVCKSRAQRRRKQKEGKKYQCPIQYVKESNPVYLEALMAETRSKHDVESESFLASPLGVEYQKLDNFLTIYHSFDNCQKDSKFWTNSKLKTILNRAQTNASIHALELSCREQTDDSFDNKSTILDLFSNVSEIVEGGSKTVDSHLSQLENKISLASFEKSIEARVSFDHKFTDKNMKAQVYDKSLIDELCFGSKKVPYSTSRGTRYKTVKADLCSKEDKQIFSALIKKNKEKISNEDNDNISPIQIASDINTRVEKLNKILGEYKEEKDKLRKEWNAVNLRKAQKRKDGVLPARRQDRVRSRRSKKLKALKKKVFERYQLEYALLHAGKGGDLLQTNSVKDAGGFRALEEQRAKFLGLGGFEEKVFEDTNDFPKLKNISEEVAKKSVSEALDRTKKQVQDVLKLVSKKRTQDQSINQEENSDKIISKKKAYDEKRVESLKGLIQTNPMAVGEVLIKHPELAPELCMVGQELALDQRNKDILEGGTYVVIGGGIAIAGIATMGGALPATAMIAATAASAAFTVADHSYQLREKSRKLELQEAMLSAYITSNGDQQSIGEIRKTWQSAMEADFNAKMALGFGIFDIMGIPAAARSGAFLRLAKNMENFDRSVVANGMLLGKIAKNDNHIKVINALLNTYSNERIGFFLSRLAKISPSRQDKVLNSMNENLRGGGMTVKGLLAYLKSEKINEDLTPGEIDLIRNELVGIDEAIGNLKVEYLADPELAGYVKGFSSEEQDQIFEAVYILKANGKSKDEIAAKMKRGSSECKI